MKPVYIIGIVALMCMTACIVLLITGVILQNLLFMNAAVIMIGIAAFLGAGLFIAEIMKWNDEEMEGEKK